MTGTIIGMIGETTGILLIMAVGLARISFDSSNEATDWATPYFKCRSSASNVSSGSRFRSCFEIVLAVDPSCHLLPGESVQTASRLAGLRRRFLSGSILVTLDRDRS